MTTTITGKNQITLPAELVRALGWKPGIKLDWQKLDDDSVVVRSLPTRGELARRVMGLARAEPGTDPLAVLQKMQEEEDPTF